MHSPGVEVRPLRQITGEAEFNEVYLTDARIPDANRLGPVGEGWRVSLTTLMNERTAIGGSDAPRRNAVDDAIDIWRALPAERRSPSQLDRLMTLWCKFRAVGYTNQRAAQTRRAGNPGPEGSVGKLALADLNKAAYSLCIDLLGMDGLVGYDYTFRRPEQLSVSGAEKGVQHAFLRTRANSIEGGTSEIMKNILGEQVLGLPGEPRVDKDIPWSKVPRS
jgi:alkylation response protein AidB-like acyl-CoA dehydrogenase